MSLFGRKSPEEVAELDRLSKYEALVAELQKGVTTAERNVKTAEDGLAGDTLMKNRRQRRVEAAIQRHQEALDLKREDRARHAAQELETPFDAAAHDATIAQWADEIVTRTETRDKQDITHAEGIALLVEAKRELRRAKHRLAIAELTEQVRIVRQKVAAAAALEGDGVASATVEMGLAQFMASTVGTENLVSMYLSPPPRKEIDLMGSVVFLKPTAGIAGNLDGRLYNPDDAAGFDHPTAARLVACGSARWLQETPENAAAAEQARKQLAAFDRRAEEPRVTIEMGVGMAANG